MQSNATSQNLVKRLQEALSTDIPVKCAILDVLRAGPLSISQIAGRIGKSRPYVSAYTNRLAEFRLVELRVNPINRRERLAKLSFQPELLDKIDAYREWKEQLSYVRGLPVASASNPNVSRVKGVLVEPAEPPLLDTEVRQHGPIPFLSGGLHFPMMTRDAKTVSEMIGKSRDEIEARLYEIGKVKEECAAELFYFQVRAKGKKAKETVEFLEDAYSKYNKDYKYSSNWLTLFDWEGKQDISKVMKLLGSIDQRKIADFFERINLREMSVDELLNKLRNEFRQDVERV